MDARAQWKTEQQRILVVVPAVVYDEDVVGTNDGCAVSHRNVDQWLSICIK
jgi:hypothetical protein